MSTTSQRSYIILKKDDLYCLQRLLDKGIISVEIYQVLSHLILIQGYQIFLPGFELEAIPEKQTGHRSYMMVLTSDVALLNELVEKDLTHPNALSPEMAKYPLIRIPIRESLLIIE